MTRFDTPRFYIYSGAYFDYHPEIQQSVGRGRLRGYMFAHTLSFQAVDVLDKTHPSTIMLPDKWHLLDEMCVCPAVSFETADTWKGTILSRTLVPSGLKSF
jgi:hypothetical protein